MKKKILFSIVLILAISFTILTASSFAAEDEIIEITDENLKTKLLNSKYYEYNEENVYTSYDIDANQDGEISKSEIQKLTTLTFYQNDKKLPDDFSALKYATSLVSIHISGLNLESMSKLSELTSLTTLSYVNGANSKYTIDLDGIENLTNLKYLTITDNIKNIDKIGNLSNLESLVLTYCNISDISFIKNLTKLTSLNLGHNNIADISILQELNSLKYITLENNNIEEINITLPTNLETLNLHYNKFKKLVLKDHSKIRSISIGFNEINSVELENLPNLQNLYVLSNKISEVSLTNVNELKTINVTDNNIINLDFLSGLNKLEDVYLNANEINPEEYDNATILATLKEKGVKISIDEYNNNIGLEYTLNSNGTGYVVSKFRGFDITKVEVPSTYENLPVVEIGDNAFYDVYSRFNIEEIVLPETITKIGYRAFNNCKKLKNINIPESALSIGKETFANCISLENITLPSKITTIPYGMFYGCTSLNNVIIPETVTDIKPTAFQNCYSITEMTIPDSVIYFGSNGEYDEYQGTLFSGCKNLRKITLSKNITKIDHNTFSGCEKLETLVIPEGVTTIDGCGLSGCTAMKKLVLPKSFVNLEEGIDGFSNRGFNPVVYGYKGTVAEETAKAAEFEFVALDDYVKEDLDSVEVNGENIMVLPISKETGLDYINEENFPTIDDYEIKVLDKNGNEKSDSEKIGSKCVIKITDELGNIFAEFTVVVSGDVTGNGYSRMYDAFLILKDSINSKQIDAIDEKIRDFNEDGKVRMYDAFQFLKASILGK